MVGFIYITTNTINGKKYIGRKKYMDGWEEYLGSSKLLLKDIEKYGTNAFKREILEECSTYEELQLRELYWQLHYKVKESPDFYNLTYASEGFDTSGTKFTYSPEELKKIWPIERRKKSSDIWKNPCKNPNNLEHVKQLRSKKMKDDNPSFREDVKQKISDKKSKPFQLEYQGEIYTFKNIRASVEKFGNAAISALTTGYKKNKPFKGLKFVTYL